ncbi:hypothetical protein LEP1GSC186_4492 [Leptospira noguchii serovar Autumnalis str. ZUN142]|uniref:Uncharacterized protein n=1 Tax=Leptospira noguchii serovar Autumnalis str. ZUN142 TaxID=1085540 RepID=M6U6M5_9LEPT|nr:hypothetical protein LEP1GSC186_4492 [Leptospira noguchii serovar Autumnalis str. ZUN142]
MTNIDSLESLIFVPASVSQTNKLKPNDLNENISDFSVRQ